MQNRKILFISYFFPPYNSVGVKRTAYWAKNIVKFNFEAIVFTAIDQNSKNEIVHNVPKSKRNLILSYFIKDEGINWIKGLKSKLANYYPKDFDFIIISGGPFMHMLITKFLKKKFSAKIILDFRDPFYSNPRFKSNKIKDWIKLYYQTKFLKYADVIITVNDECKKLISHKRINIIDNGYDETVLEDITKETATMKSNSHKEIRSCAVGRVYYDFNIDYFFKAIISYKEISFSYIGDSHFKGYEQHYNHNGILQYEDALKFISNFDFCIIFTGGEAFESTTKVFDYLALNKIILIITNGEVKMGSLHNITKDYPNTFWSKNDTKSILSAFKEIENHKIIKVDTYKYSRASGLKKLINILNE